MPASWVAREIRQNRPFRSPSQEALIALLCTTERIRRALACVVESAGITLQQYNVLRILRGAGGEGLPTLEIAHRMIEGTPGITRLLDRLEAKALVRRERCRQDRRQVLCWIEPSGLALLASLDDPVDRADESLLATLSAAEQRQLIQLLDKIRQGDRNDA